LKQKLITQPSIIKPRSTPSRSNTLSTPSQSPFPSSPIATTTSTPYVPISPLQNTPSLISFTNNMDTCCVHSSLTLHHPQQQQQQEQVMQRVIPESPTPHGSMNNYVPFSPSMFLNGLQSPDKLSSPSAFGVQHPHCKAVLFPSSSRDEGTAAVQRQFATHSLKRKDLHDVTLHSLSFFDGLNVLPQGRVELPAFTLLSKRVGIQVSNDYDPSLKSELSNINACMRSAAAAAASTSSTSTTPSTYTPPPMDITSLTHHNFTYE
jgi:hypothetical protein